MKSTYQLWGVSILILSVISVSNYFIYDELRSISENLVKGVAPVAQSTQQPLVETSKDGMLLETQNNEAKNRLINLRAIYALAPVQSTNNNLLYGKDNTRLTLQEYSDVECPYCRKIHAELKKVVDNSEGVINWEFKHFPLSSHNPAAAVSAQAIECINESYDNRTAWVAIDQFIEHTNGNGKGIDDMTTFFRSFGLNGTLISNCIASDDHKDTINTSYKEGNQAGITSTPAIIIVDNQTGKKYLVKGYKTAEMLLHAIQKILQS